MSNHESESSRLAEIHQRAQAATQGPWTNGMRGSGSSGDAHMCRVYARREASKGVAAHGEQVALTWHPEHIVSYVCFSRQQNVDNAEFIAHAREDIPYLLALLTAQSARLHELEQEIQELKELARRHDPRTEQFPSTASTSSED